MTRRAAVGACRFAEVVYELMVRTLESYVDPLPIVVPVGSDSPSVAAREARRRMGITPGGPIQNLVHLVEMSGVLVLALPIQFERIDAFSAWVSGDPRRPVIALCRVEAGDRLRWSVAHEWGHITLHSDQVQLRAEHHRQADEFAAEFMLPEIALRQDFAGPVTLSSVASLKPKWGVSMQSLIRRAFDLDIISDRQYRRLFTELSARGWRTREPGNLDVAIEKPRGLRQVAQIAYGNPINYERFAVEANLNVEMLKQVLREYAETQTTDSRSTSASSVSSKVIQLRR